ncbi:MAG: DUF5946 family protein [Bryobacteraceae bacterium]|nr:DUF5946 family protein [Bryobacteraceae bacterium]
MNCLECGATDCARLRDDLLARDFEQPALYWQYHRLAVDAYCVQHAAYVESAKSLAAHLCGLCIALERGNDQGALRQLQRWLSTNPAIVKPALPAHRGKVTIERLRGVSTPEEYGRSVEEWARSAWDACRELHYTARDWLLQASLSPPSARRHQNR